MINGYYNRYSPSKGYDRHLFRAGYVLQSAELNEIQSRMADGLRGVADSLFKDGDIIRDARIVVDPDTGAVVAESGALYVAGLVRGVTPGNFSIPVDQTVRVGVYLRETIVTALEDPELRDPAVGVRNFQEEGAARMLVSCTWGYDGDGQLGEFYTVYFIDNGIVRSKEPPPQLDSVTQALARYDRDNSGGTYVVSGLSTTGQGLMSDGRQVFLVAEGRARVNGFAVDLSTSRRIIENAQPDLLLVDSEPHVSTNATSMRVNVDRAPVASIETIRITAEKTVTLTHGSYVGAADILPDNAVLQIVEVKQGATTYVTGTDYRLQAGAVDWSLQGSEPATGSTYTVKYRYIKTVLPQDPDSDGCTVIGAVVDSLILVTYKAKLPRVDVLAVNEDGTFEFVKGRSSTYSPVAPDVPAYQLPLANIYQTWRGSPTVRQTGTRMVSMGDLQDMNSRMDAIVDLIAQNRLVSDVSLRESAASKGLFVDAFIGDDKRDNGITQNAAIFSGELTLPVTVSVSRPLGDVVGPAAPAYTHEVFLEQPLRTGSMLVNPYQAFDPVPATVTLNPAFDRWSVTNTNWTGSITERIVIGSGSLTQVISSTTSTQLFSTTTQADPFLRPITVSFTVDGFGPGEILDTLLFDGIAISPI